MNIYHSNKYANSSDQFSRKIVAVTQHIIYITILVGCFSIVIAQTKFIIVISSLFIRAIIAIKPDLGLDGTFLFVGLVDNVFIKSILF